MEALTPEFIAQVANTVHPGLTYHPSAIAYIAALLAPYANAIVTASVAELLEWVPRAFPGQLAKHAVSEVTKAATKKRQELDTNTDNDDVAKAARIAVIEYLIAEITELSGNHATHQVDYMVLPWDIQVAVAGDTELSRLLGIPVGSNTLPVTVMVNGEQVTHMLTVEFTVGLLLFSAPGVGNHDFHITMFGQRLDPLYLIQPSDRYDLNEKSRFGVGMKNGYPYELTLNNLVDTYWFNNTDFMQGFITGAQWAGVDHHHYWRRLIRHEANGTETELTF